MRRGVRKCRVAVLGKLSQILKDLSDETLIFLERNIGRGTRKW
ncbi:MAG: hypothetical protein AB4080_10725 [Trichodesmium sp.]